MNYPMHCCLKQKAEGNFEASRSRQGVIVLTVAQNVLNCFITEF